MTWLMNIIGYPLGWIIWLVYKVIPIYSIALIIFTVIVRAVMIPLSVKQHKNTMHMQLLRPKVEEIQKKYKNNPQKSQEEVNKFYEKEGYNPFSGCSTMFLQLPIMYGLIDVVYRPMTHLLRMPADIIDRATQILTKINPDFAGKRAGIDVQLRILGNLSENKDALINGFKDIEGIGAEAFEQMSSIDLNLFGINLGAVPEWGWNLLMFIPILSLVTALLSSVITMKMSDQNNGQGKGCTYGMMFGMPFMSAYFSFLVPAGVGLYWIISNVVGTVQSIVLRKIITPEYVAEKLKADKQKGKKKKKSKFMQKLIEAQEAAAAQQGAASDSEVKAAKQKNAQVLEAEKKLSMSDQEKLAAARKRYAEKYGDE